MKLLVVASIVLAVIGAAMCALELRSQVETQYAMFFLYVVAVVSLQGTAFMLCYRRFGAEMKRDQLHWYRPILRACPAAVKVIALVGALGSFAVAYYLSGGGVHVSDWTAAEPKHRATLWVAFGLFTYVSLLGVAAFARPSEAERA